MAKALPIKMRPLESLEPAEINPRKISEIELAKLKNSLEQWGMVEPLILNKKTGRLVGGHQRARAANELGWEEVPVLEVDLDDDEAAGLNLALNNIGGSWDRPALARVLEILEPWLVELAGFDPEDLTPARPETEAELVEFTTSGHAWTGPDDHRIRCPHRAGKCQLCADLQEILE